MNPGCTLKNGSVLLAIKKILGGIIVLAKWEGHYHPYVTWRMDDEGNTYWGHYFAEYREAKNDFDKRDVPLTYA